MPQCKQGQLKLERREIGLDVFLFYMKNIGKAYSKPALGNQGSENSGQEAFDELKRILIPPPGPSHRMGQESWCENDRPAEKHLIQIGGFLEGCRVVASQRPRADAPRLGSYAWAPLAWRKGRECQKQTLAHLLSASIK